MIPDRDAGRPSRRTPARRRVSPPPLTNYRDAADDAERVERARARSAAVPAPVLMLFGRHVGTRVDQLPASYLCWLQTAEVRSPRLRAAIDQAHARHCDRDHAPEWEPWR
jgi:hypothetical protein